MIHEPGSIPHGVGQVHAIRAFVGAVDKFRQSGLTSTEAACEKYYRSDTIGS